MIAYSSKMASAAALDGLWARRHDRHDRLIPMINVVFLLLLFFVIAGTFRAADRFDVEPPEIAAAESADVKGFTLIVTASGEMAVGEKALDGEGVVDRARQWTAANPDGVIQIKADREAPAKIIIPLLADLSRAGVDAVRLIAVTGEAPQ